MASVLSLRPQSPFKRSFSDNPYLRSCSPFKDSPLGTLREAAPRNGSACSLYTIGAIGSRDWFNASENTPPLTSRSLLDLGQDQKVEAPTKTSLAISSPARAYQGLDFLPIPHIEAPTEPYGRKRKATDPITEPSSSDDNLVVEADNDTDDRETSELLDIYDAMSIPLPEGRLSDNTGSEPSLEVEELAIPLQVSPQPFRRWMSTLKRRHVHRRKDAVSELPLLAVQTISGPGSSSLSSLLQVPDSLRRDSLSSSMAGVTAMASTSMTIASASIAPRSEAFGIQAKARVSNRSSHFSDARKSTESNTGGLGPILDESAWLRSIQRRKIVEEIIASEESYIGDLKILINVSFYVPALVLADQSSGLFHDVDLRPYIISPDSCIHPT